MQALNRAETEHAKEISDLQGGNKLLIESIKEKTSAMKSLEAEVGSLRATNISLEFSIQKKDESLEKLKREQQTFHEQDARLREELSETKHQLQQEQNTIAQLKFQLKKLTNKNSNTISTFQNALQSVMAAHSIEIDIGSNDSAASSPPGELSSDYNPTTKKRRIEAKVRSTRSCDPCLRSGKSRRS